MKFAAMEGTYEDTGDPAAWTVVAWANEREHKRVFGVEIPYMLRVSLHLTNHLVRLTE